ncbi:hypothetical protein HD554DRAFT_2171423 [Boletus coccyginus]|nr:hypothetical protein HD554DRAFT_2171423 [Boletus coccyginus]
MLNRSLALAYIYLKASHSCIIRSATDLLFSLSSLPQSFLKMKLFSVVSVLVAVGSALGQTIEIGYPTDGTVFYAGEDFTAKIDRPNSIIGCTEVGIALAIASCDEEVCPEPTDRLGNVLYAGPFTPTGHTDGYYQNFSVQVPDYVPVGPAIFTLTHLCLLGGGPTPLLEFRNVSLTIDEL